MRLVVSSDEEPLWLFQDLARDHPPGSDDVCSLPTLSLRNVEDLLHERGIEVSHETIRFWWNRFGPIFAAEIRKKRMDRMRAFSGWRWHLDEMFVKINGEGHYLWRAVDQEGEVLEAFVSKKRDREAALKFLRKLMKRYGRPAAIITDRLRSYRAALRELGGSGLQQAGPLAEQSCGEFTPAVPATRTRHAPFQADAKPPEIRRRPFCRLQPLQPATTPLFMGQFQAQSRRCARPVASTRGGLIPCRRWRTQTREFPLTVPDGINPVPKEDFHAGSSGKTKALQEDLAAG